MTIIRIGTRGSKLALWQAEWVAGRLNQAGYATELVTISTKGDVSAASLSQVGGQGVFVKEIQRSLLNDEVDVAVHSLKDLPTASTEGLCLAAVPPRESTDDCLISRGGEEFEMLPVGSRIGTGSLRRGAQLQAWRADIQVADIRGNVDSRIRKLEEGKYEAIILAAAGLTRLKLLDHVAQHLPIERMLPAVGQGALGIECRVDDTTTRSAVAVLDNPQAHAAVLAERALLAGLLAGCLAPVAALGEILPDGQLRLTARVLASNGQRQIDGQREGSPNSATEIGRGLAEDMLQQGAAELIAAARQ